MVVSTKVLSAPSDACAIVMEYVRERNAKTDHEKVEEGWYYRQMEPTVYDVFAKIVIKDAVSSVIFLDIDGVIFDNRMNSSVQEFDKNALSSLYKLISIAKRPAIVLSSNWRQNSPIGELRSLFEKYFFSNLIIDKTPDNMDRDYQKEKASLSNYSGRGREIAYWLQKHPSITNFVILDDCDSGLSESFSDHFVKTDPAQLLIDRDVDKARKIFKDK